MSLKDSLITQHVTFSCVDQISVIVDRFGRSLRFCHLEFDKEVILMVTGLKIPGIDVKLSDFRKLSFCGPYKHDSIFLVYFSQ